VAINDWLKKTIQKVYDQLSDDNDEDDEDGDGNGDTSSNGDDEVDANNDEDLNGAFQVQQSESHRQSSKAQINVNDSSSSSSSPPSIATKSTNPTISYCLPATQTNKADLPRLVKPESEQPEDTKKSMGRKSAQEAWSIAHKEPIVAALESIYQKCNKTCHLTGNCASGVNGEEILKLRKAFHGEKRDDAPKDKQRAEIILKYFEEATKDAKDNLSFKIGSKLVCLPTLLRFLGVTRSPDIRDAPRQWTRLQKGFLSTKDKETLLSAKELKIDAEERYHNKAGKCTRFIDEYCTFFSDCIPIALAEDENGEPVSTVVVPFRTIADFYAEYVFYSQSKDPPVLEQDMAGITVFSTAWKDAFNKKIVKFMGGKSGIPTCATCNNMKQIKTSACCKRDEITRKVLIKLARLHLLQQKAERQHAENFIEAAGKLNVDGQPELAYADIDGQSVWTGNSPRMKIGGRSIKFDKVIENRNIGVRIVCGPIDEYISICTNNLIPGGANVLVEVTRYTIGYIARRLAEFGMIMPKKIGFQFDNSGENKV
jgi:hypothetical protein